MLTGGTGAGGSPLDGTGLRPLKTKFMSHLHRLYFGCFVLALAATAAAAQSTPPTLPVTSNPAVAHDVSLPLSALIAQAPAPTPPRPRVVPTGARRTPPPPPAPVVPPPVDPAAAAIEQTTVGTRPAAALVASFDGLTGRNPSDNSLAIGPDAILQTVNSNLAIYSKTGDLRYGPIISRTVFNGFKGECGEVGFGDVVVRYDQLAKRWVFVMPIFRKPTGSTDTTPYGMCYAVSATSDLLGRYYRYDFARTLFPDYPRLGVWPDGYYLGTSTGDTVIQKHACVADRTAMLKGRDAREQCAIADGINFLNPADIEGRATPPSGAPNLMFAGGGTQLHNDFESSSIFYYKFHVDWKQPSRSTFQGPYSIAVAPYHYLCNGQLTSCVPQPGTENRLDAQGDKLMQRLVYRKIGKRELLLVEHSVNTADGGGGVRWYELQLDPQRNPVLVQQGTYAPKDSGESSFRWMASLGLDHAGNIAAGYSFGDAKTFAGQRFSGRLASDPPGKFTLAETVLAEGGAAQTNTVRWEDYTTMDVDPSDDCTFWYVGDYLKPNATSYTTRIGAIRLPGCH